jgi:hypothetical protein
MHNFCFFSVFFGNFRREVGSMLSEISKRRRVKIPSDIYRPGDLLPYTLLFRTEDAGFLGLS